MTETMKYYECLFNGLWIVNVFMLAAMLFEQDSLTSAMFYSSFFILIAMLCVQYFYHHGIRYRFYLFVFIILLAFIATLFGDVSFNYLKKWLMFCSTLLFFYLAEGASISKRSINFVLNLNVILSLLFIFMYLYNPVYSSEGNLKFNFPNSNTTGLWLFVNAVYLVIKLNLSANKLLCAIIYGFLVYLIYLTNSRTALLCISALTLYILIPNKQEIKPINKYFIALLLISPFVFSLAYLLLYYSIPIDHSLFLGKELFSGREAIWLEGFEVLAGNLIFGGYNIFAEGAGAFQMHNSHVDIMCSYGIPVFILTIVYLYKICLKINCTITDRVQKRLLMAFLVCIMLGCGEAVLFSGGLGLYIFVGTLLSLAKSSNIIERKLKREESL